MKFEVLPNKKKRITIALLIIGVIAIVGIATFNLTRAKYQYTKSIPLIRANNISYSKSDLEIVAIKLQQDDGTYKDTMEIPSSGYHLNEDISKSYCKVGDITNKINYRYDNGEWYINVKNKGNKCYLTFDKGEPIDLVEHLLASNGGESAIKAKGNPDFSKTSCTPGTYDGTSRTCGENTTGMWAMEDDYGTSYYFRGSPTNNYIKFGKYADNYPVLGYYSSTSDVFKEYSNLNECTNASSYNINCTSLAGKDMYWRIIRINGDGSIRIIYDGTEYHPNGTSTVNSIAVRSAINPKSNDNMYVGYTYATGAKRGAGTSSTAKTKLDSWYTSSGLSNYDSYLADSGFCGDRTSITTSRGIPNNTGGTGTTTTYYGANYRLYKKSPDLKCSTISYGTSTNYETGNKADVYTTKKLVGNGELQYPIGLINLDEVVVAGGNLHNGSTNYSYYLYNGRNYWTMSPSHHYNISSAFVVQNEGYLNEQSVISNYGLRPVINLDPSKINNVSIDSNGVYVIS